MYIHEIWIIGGLRSREELFKIGMIRVQDRVRVIAQLLLAGNDTVPILVRRGGGMRSTERSLV